MAKLNEQQSKYDFYVTALVFTLLGASVQTAKFYGTLFPDLLEIGSWAALLGAGLLQLSRLEYFGKIAQATTSVTKETERLSEFKAMDEASQKEEDDKLSKLKQLEGTEEWEELKLMVEKGRERAADRISDAEDSLKKIETGFASIDEADTDRYETARKFFIIGIVLVVSARAWPPLAALFCSLVAFLDRLRLSVCW